jgi:alpha-tubulin suppressor-like RCC1 family protein
MSGRLLACGEGAALGVDGGEYTLLLIPVASMAGIRVRSVVASKQRSLALDWDGRVYLLFAQPPWQVGQGDVDVAPSPVRLEGLEDVCGIASAAFCSFAVTHLGDVFMWGRDILRPIETEDEALEDSRLPILVEGLRGVRVRRVYAGSYAVHAVGEAGELFSWGYGGDKLLGHGDTHSQLSPKLVEALRGTRVSSLSVGPYHALALTEDGLVYAWGEDINTTVILGKYADEELEPTPIEALRGVRVGSVAAGGCHSYAVTDTGELWAWGLTGSGSIPLGHGEQADCRLPKPIASLRGINVDAGVNSFSLTMARAEDGSVYAWATSMQQSAVCSAWDSSVSAAQDPVPIPQRIPTLRVACGGL